MTRYTTIGRRGGSCGHAHATPEDAIACLLRYEALVRGERADAGVTTPFDTDRHVAPVVPIEACGAKDQIDDLRCQLPDGHHGAHEAWRRTKAWVAGTDVAVRWDAPKTLGWAMEPT